jgi:hypothetical protein
MKDEKMSAEMADIEFKRFADSMDIDIDPEGMDESDKKNFQKAKRKLIRAICRGALFINDDGEPVYTLQRGKEAKTITFHEPQAKNQMVFDKVGDENVKGALHLMAEITGELPATFAEMYKTDYQVCQSIMAFFSD